MKHLTNKEEEMMNIFWEKGSIYVKDTVHDEMAVPNPSLVWICNPNPADIGFAIQL